MDKKTIFIAEDFACLPEGSYRNVGSLMELSDLIAFINKEGDLVVVASPISPSLADTLMKMVSCKLVFTNRKEFDKLMKETNTYLVYMVTGNKVTEYAFETPQLTLW